MRLALAQVDMRLGDVEGICARIEEQAALAHAQGASLVALPAPLFAGVLPGSLVESGAYMRDVLRELAELAGRVAATCLVPIAAVYDGVPFFEVVMLKEGRVVPMRTACAMARGGSSDDVWAPPAFDVEGVRVGVTFDAARDMEHMPGGCDLVIYFQVNGLDVTCEETSAVASVRDGKFRDLAEKGGMWLACMAPVGAFDEAVYTGGSFVMDDAGRVVAAAPCFEEGLILCDVMRGCPAEAVADQDLPQFSRPEWLWEALCLYVRDTVSARGSRRAVVELDGGLPSSLAAVLAVDALGSRNVTGVLVERADIFTPAQEAAERERVEAVRRLAENLHVELVEADAPSAGILVDAGGAPRPATAGLARSLAALIVADVASRRSALIVSPLTKTDFALAAPELPSAPQGDLAPFGDVYATQLEELARYRNRRAASMPGALMGPHAVERHVRGVLAAVNRACQELPSYAERVAQVLSGLDAFAVDRILAAHVDRNADAAEISLPGVPDEAVRLLLLQVRRGEAARRRLPQPPLVSARSFVERGWPQSLAWSDVGRTDDAPALEDLGRLELERFEELAPDAHARAREEVFGLLGELLGLSDEQQAELMSDEGQRRIQEQMERFEQELRRVLGAAAESRGASPFDQMPPGGGMPLFSLN